MPTIVGILTFISIINTTSERLKARSFFFCRYFSFYEQLKFHAQLNWAKFYNLGACTYVWMIWLLSMKGSPLLTGKCCCCCCCCCWLQYIDVGIWCCPDDWVMAGACDIGGWARPRRCILLILNPLPPLVCWLEWISSSGKHLKLKCTIHLWRIEDQALYYFFSCSTQLSTIFSMLINVKMPTIYDKMPSKLLAF